MKSNENEPKKSDDEEIVETDDDKRADDVVKDETDDKVWNKMLAPIFIKLYASLLQSLDKIKTMFNFIDNHFEKLYSLIRKILCVFAFGIFHVLWTE